MESPSSSRSPMPHGTKRDADSLFVDQNEEAPRDNQDQTPRDSKRSKSGKEELLAVIKGLNIDDDGNVPGYDPNNEGRPKLSSYHPDFPKTEELMSLVAKDTRAAYNFAVHKGLKSDEIKTICNSLDEDFNAPQRHYPLVQHVALLGPPGIGKSSTINSLLNQNAATETQDKQRGTNLVHEYCARTLRQGAAKFQVEAPYLSSAQISDFVKTHCDIIFDTIEQEDDEEKDTDDAFLRELRATSVDLFNILLCDKKAFATEDSIVEYFRTRHEADEQEKVYTYLEKEINKIKSSKGLQDGIQYLTANDTRELAKVFRQISRVPNAGDGRRNPHPWPIVQKVIIGMENDLLSAGAVLGDAPGTGDANTAVVDATTNYLRTAGTVIIFDTPTRENKGSTMDDNLRLLIGLNKTDQIILVVPRIDTLASLTDEQRDDLDTEDEILIRAAESVIASVKSQAKKVRLDKQALSKPGLTFEGFEEIQKLDATIKDLEIATAFAEARKKQVIINIHCRHREKMYQRKMQDIAKSRHVSDLEIFFISNQEYAKHREGYDARQPPILDIEGTGIPRLRRRLFHVPVRGRAEALEFLYNRKLPDTLMSIKGVLTKSRMERKAEVATALSTELRQFENVTAYFEADLAKAFKENVADVIDQQMDAYQDQAEEHISEWENFPTGTFTAFCRRGGLWKIPKTKTKLNWNRLLQEILKADDSMLPKGFDRFIDGIKQSIANLTTNMTKTFNQLANKLEDNPDFKGVSGKDGFIKVIRATRDSTLHAVKVLQRDMVNDFTKVRAATIFNPDESFIAQSMRKTYTDCAIAGIATIQAQKDGSKKTKRRCGAHVERVKMVREKITGIGSEQPLYDEVKVLAQEEFDATKSKWSYETVDVELKKAAAKLKKEFNHRFAMVEDDVKSEDPELAEGLIQAVDNAFEVVNGRMADYVRSWMACEDRKA